MIKVGDKVRWREHRDPCEVWDVRGERALLIHAEVFRGSGNGVWVVLVDDLTLVEAAPAKERHLDDRQGWEVERDTLKAENARLREALQMAVDTIAHNGPDGVSMAAALGIRPSIRHKETP